ncbi:MAG: hypothetical protein E7Y34_01220, partial [Mycoplasma sp.]|nr:hypothetical protein [Mycoplasma sp.]
MQVIDWKIYKLKSLNFRILICSLLFCLSFLLDIFFHLPFLTSFSLGFVKINLSLIFVFPIFYYSGPIFGLLILALQFLITSFFDLSYGADQIAGVEALFFSHFIKFISNLTTILMMYIFSKVVYYLHLKSHNQRLFIVFILTIIFSSLLISLLN